MLGGCTKVGPDLVKPDATKELMTKRTNWGDILVPDDEQTGLPPRTMPDDSYRWPEWWAQEARALLNEGGVPLTRSKRIRLGKESQPHTKFWHPLEILECIPRVKSAIKFNGNENTARESYFLTRLVYLGNLRLHEPLVERHKKGANALHAKHRKFEKLVVDRAIERWREDSIHICHLATELHGEFQPQGCNVTERTIYKRIRKYAPPHLRKGGRPRSRK